MGHYNKLNNKSEALGAVATYSSFVRWVSASRQAMVTSQIPQALPINGAEPPRTLTGFEEQLSHYCFGAKAPCDMLVIDVIQKYARSFGRDSIQDNPLITIIFQDMDTGVYDSLNVESYVKNHDTFGFQAVFTDELKNIRPGAIINKGTLLSHSTNIKNGLYGTGLMAEVAYLAVPGVIEDGFVVSESFNKRCVSKSIHNYTESWGKDYVPLNIYGTRDDPKTFPEVGTRVRDDGILFALRKRVSAFDVAHHTPEALMEPNPITDRIIYTEPGSYVYDISVISNKKAGKYQVTPEQLGRQANRYADMQTVYADKVLEVFNKIRKDVRGNTSKLGPTLLNLATQAIADNPSDLKRRGNYGSKKPIKRTWRAESLDEFRIEISTVHDFHLKESAKLTDFCGGKGVECSILPDEMMPIDDFGNRAEILVYGRSAIARLNPGQLYEQYINAASRDVTLDVKEMMNKGNMDGALKHLLGYYDITSPPMSKELRRCSKMEVQRHLEDVDQYGIYLHIPADNDWISIDTYEDIQNFRPPNMSPVTYVNSVGEKVRTHAPVLIGPKYMIVLEKSDSKSMASSGSRLQHHGLPAPTNRKTRNATPTKQQASRAYGESEIRIIGAVIGGYAVAHLVDMTTNPAVHKQVVEGIMRAPDPANIPQLVDRNELPLGNSRPVAFNSHLMECMGVRISKISSGFRSISDEVRMDMLAKNKKYFGTKKKKA